MGQTYAPKPTSGAGQRVTVRIVTYHGDREVARSEDVQGLSREFVFWAVQFQKSLNCEGFNGEVILKFRGMPDPELTAHAHLLPAFATPANTPAGSS